VIKESNTRKEVLSVLLLREKIPSDVEVTSRPRK
jgi:hypothetical protein